MSFYAVLREQPAMRSSAKHLLQ